MEFEELAAVLGVAPEAIVEAEGVVPGVTLRVRIAEGDGSREVLVRGSASEAAQNHAAVLEALEVAAFGFAPRLTALSRGVLAETFADGLTALSFVPPATALESAVDAIATMHGLGLREGLRWERDGADLVPGSDLALHRLGFAAHEREPALAAIAEARAALGAGPIGFVHGELHAGHVVFARNGPVLVEFGAGGQGQQLCDVAAFLATAGLEPTLRRELAERYAKRRGRPAEMADAIDLATLPWGLEWLMDLPRRQVMALGDEAATERLSVLAARIHDALRRPASEDRLAAAIRGALWP